MSNANQFSRVTTQATGRLFVQGLVILFMCDDCFLELSERAQQDINANRHCHRIVDTALSQSEVSCQWCGKVKFTATRNGRD